MYQYFIEILAIDVFSDRLLEPNLTEYGPFVNRTLAVKSANKLIKKILKRNKNTNFVMPIRKNLFKKSNTAILFTTIDTKQKGYKDYFITVIQRKINI